MGPPFSYHQLHFKISYYAKLLVPLGVPVPTQGGLSITLVVHGHGDGSLTCVDLSHIILMHVHNIIMFCVLFSI